MILVKRLIALIIDGVIASLFFYLSLFSLVYMHASVNIISCIPPALLHILMFSKDSINGMSPGKRIMGIQVIDWKTLKVADPIQCAIRNLFLFIWPIEILVILFSSTDLRIGDRIAHTKVVESNNKFHLFKWNNKVKTSNSCLG